MSAQKTRDSTDKLKGSVKEAIGKLIGDSQVEAEGADQQKSPKSDLRQGSDPKQKTVP